MTAPRNLRAASQPLKQTVDAARLVAHSILGLYPVPDLSRCLESPARHLLGQLPLLIWAQKPRLAPACHIVPQHSLHTSLSIPAHPRLYRPVVHSHSCRRLTELPSRPDQPQSMESCTKDNVMLPAAVSFRTLRRWGPHRGGRAVGLPRAHRRGGAGGPGQEHLPERRGPGQPQHRPAAGPSQGDGGASWATTRTTPHTSSPSLASATGCRGARRRILLNDDSAPHEWCRLTT